MWWVMQAYSDTTGRAYPSWDALVEAEANGWVALAVMTHREITTWPWIVGPYATKREAENARSRMRSKWKRELWMRPEMTAKFFVRPAWKDDRERA